MGQVANTPTPTTPAQALGYLLAAGVPQSALLMVAAQSAIETAAWGSKTGHGFNNWNMGNVTPSVAQLGAGIDWMTQGVSGMRYIAYSNGVEGARGMLGWIMRHGLLTAASNGDLDSYMSGLQAGAYLGQVGQVDPTGHTVSQSDYDNYRAGISAYMKSLAGVAPIMPSWWDTLTLADRLLVGVAGAAAGTLAFVAARQYGYL